MKTGGSLATTEEPTGGPQTAARERVTVTVRSSLGDAASLTVQDAMRQISDFFDLLSAAGGEDRKAVSWRLVDVSMMSPLSATAEAFPEATGVLAEPIARREKDRLSSSFREIAEKGRVPTWMDAGARARAHAFFKRNLNGVGRTDIKFGEHLPLTVIAESSARAALIVLEAREPIELVDAAEDDLSRSEIGSLEGNILRLDTFRGRPAVRLRERVHGWEFPCILSPVLAEEIGHQHDWAEVWGGRRVLVVGEILFGPLGNIARVLATSIRPVDASALSYADIADPNFTNGLAVPDYLNQLWEDEVG